LSGAVFALGLVAGHEMFRQNQPDVSQVSTTYPLPSPPAGGATSASVGSPAAISSSASSSTSSSAMKPVAPPVAAGAPAARPSVASVARVKPPAPALSPAPTEEDEGTPAAASGPATAAKPYNIQIEAVMDKSGADEMVSRLKTLGYNAQEAKTTLNGQTWYRVRVGPYNSEEEAKAAQEKLREQYKQAYTTSH
jgi:cell division protein FtsN